MSSQININLMKSSKLLELLLRGVDKRYYHALYLTSCYFSPDSAIRLIEEVSNLVKLKEVFIYIDRKTASAVGKDELQHVCNNFPKFTVKLYAVDATALFHSKAYAIISYEKNESIYRGSLIIGSSNLTGSGLMARVGNIESLLDTQDVELLSDFLSQLKKLNLLDIEEIDDFKSTGSLAFKYAMLLEGSFIHKWLDNLGQYLSVRFQLNDYGKSRIGDDVFKNAGFNIDTATISKRYFKFDYEPPHLENTENLVRNFGVETYLGHWIPNSALETLFERNTFDEFSCRLKEQIALQLVAMKAAIRIDMDYLESMKIIQPSELSPLESFQAKIDALLENDAKLKRIFSKYEIFSLPYDVAQKDKIEELFDQMISFIHSRARKNISQKLFLDAVNSASIGSFRASIQNACSTSLVVKTEDVSWPPVD